MAKKTTDQSFHSQHDGYTVPVVKQSSPSKKTTPSQKLKDNDMPERKHAGRVWNEKRPHKKPESTLANTPEVPDQKYPTKAHPAPGVPSSVMKGYLKPGAKPRKSRGAIGGYSGAEADDGTYPAGAHTSYD